MTGEVGKRVLGAVGKRVLGSVRFLVVVLLRQPGHTSLTTAWSYCPLTLYANMAHLG